MEEDQAPETTLPPPLAERYVDLTLLGKGGMGEVFRATDRKLNRLVALKIIRKKTDRDRERAKRFAREALALAKLSHPNVVRLFDYQVEGDMALFTMEYIKGRPLSEIMRAESIEAETAATIAAQIADGLACAHEARILHRDLKPQNVMVTADGTAKLLDFGVAKFVDDAATLTALTRTGHVVGTVRYLPPEIFARQEASKASDVYQLATVLYETLADRHPLEGTDSRALLDLSGFRSIRPPSAYEPSVDETLDAIVMDGLTISASTRPSASELRDRLRSWVGLEPIADRKADTVKRRSTKRLSTQRQAALSEDETMPLGKQRGSQGSKTVRSQGRRFKIVLVATAVAATLAVLLLLSCLRP